MNNRGKLSAVTIPATTTAIISDIVSADKVARNRENLPAIDLDDSKNNQSIKPPPANVLATSRSLNNDIVIRLQDNNPAFKPLTPWQLDVGGNKTNKNTHSTENSSNDDENNMTTDDSGNKNIDTGDTGINQTNKRYEKSYLYYILNYI